MTMTAREFIDRFAAQCGLAPLSDEEFEQLLSLASEAAHASERSAAPLSCYLAGRAGLSTRRALELAQGLVVEHPHET